MFQLFKMKFMIKKFLEQYNIEINGFLGTIIKWNSHIVKIKKKKKSLVHYFTE